MDRQSFVNGGAHQYSGARPRARGVVSTRRRGAMCWPGNRGSSIHSTRGTYSATARSRVGVPGIDFLRANRIPFRFTLALEHGAAARRRSDAAAAGESECGPGGAAARAESTADPHIVLPRSGARPDPRRPAGYFRGSTRFPVAPAQLFARRGSGAPWDERFIGLLRPEDWLHLLGFELNGGRFGCYAPPFENPLWLSRFSFMDRRGRAGGRSWVAPMWVRAV